MSPFHSVLKIIIITQLKIYVKPMSSLVYKQRLLSYLGFRNERPLSYLASRIERLLSYLGLRNKRFHVVIEAEVDHVEGTVSEKSSSETFVEATQAKAIPGDNGTGLRICRLLLQKHVRTHGRI